jgi:ribosomal protein L33
MKRLIIFICCTLCVPTAAIAGVSNIRHMSRNSNDSFDVICLNGVLETVNSRTILDNSVCKNATDQSSSASKSVVCTGSGSISYITRISDGNEIGRFLPLKDCQESIRASSKSLVCTGSGSISYITRISDGKELGRFLPLKDCQESIRASSKSVVCTGSGSISYITRISDGKELGRFLPLEDCQESTRASSDNNI